MGLDGKHTVFGKVVDGLDVVDKIEEIGSQSGATAKPVVIAKSGEITDTHKEYLQDLSRIASPDYIPTHQDILMARIRTTQITTERYRIDGIVYELHDVGGQRSERRKWICCFE